MSDSRYRKVPSARLSRLASFGQLAGGIAGGMLAEGARRLAAGERPQLSDMLLTPGNAMRLTEQLSRLRGAAMKLGQMISLDAGDLLPAELTAILSRLRDSAHYMPPSQLNQVLIGEWGKDWRKRFTRFEATPIAAASIGQVHRATLPDGRLVAIKVQYPGLPPASTPMSIMSRRCCGSQACCRAPSTSRRCWPRPSSSCAKRPTMSARRRRCGAMAHC